MKGAEFVSAGGWVRRLATLHPDRAALVLAPAGGAEETVTWGELESRSNGAAHLLREHRVREGSMVVVGLPNSIEHFVATIGAWKLGACVLPLRAAMPARERNEILAVASPAVVIADWPDVSGRAIIGQDDLAHIDGAGETLPISLPHPGKAIASGGSTGRPKLIVDPSPWGMPDGFRHPLAEAIGFRRGQIQLVTGPLYHNAPFSLAHFGIFHDQTLILMDAFDAARCLDLIERHRVQFMFLVPTTMRRLIVRDDIRSRDLSSLESVYHSAAPCPAWLKRAWLDLLGGVRLFELFGAAENVGETVIRGDEWLAHPGSVGRPINCDIAILGEDGAPLPPGEIGTIYTRLHSGSATYRYVGSEPAHSTGDGFVTVGDMGWVDPDGYLYIADRRVDLIITGGANVFPAEVEAVLSEHPSVEDVVVIGVPDEEWGKRVHAIVQPLNGQASDARTLDAHCRRRLAAFKVPKTYEFVSSLPRDASGKIRRSALAAERV